MKNVILLIIKIIIYGVKSRINNAAVLIDMMENIYNVSIKINTKKMEKVMKVFVLIVTGKILDIVVDQKINTAIEMVKMIADFIHWSEVYQTLEMWLFVLITLIKWNMVQIVLTGILTISGGLIVIVMMMNNSLIKIFVVSVSGSEAAKLTIHDFNSRGSRSRNPF